MRTSRQDDEEKLRQQGLKHNRAFEAHNLAGGSILKLSIGLKSVLINKGTVFTSSLPRRAEFGNGLVFRGKVNGTRNLRRPTELF